MRLGDYHTHDDGLRHVHEDGVPGHTHPESVRFERDIDDVLESIEGLSRNLDALCNLVDDMKANWTGICQDPEHAPAAEDLPTPLRPEGA